MSERIRENLLPDLRAALLNRLQSSAELETMSDSVLRAQLAQVVTEHLLSRNLPLTERQNLINHLFHNMRGLGLLQPLLEDPAVTEIMVNGPDSVFIEKRGAMQRLPLRFRDTDHLIEVITAFFARANRNISYTRPIADLRLPDGSRAHAVLPPVAPEGPILTIRKFTGVRQTAADIVANRTISAEALSFLQSCVSERRAVFICGGTGSGKTTLLNILSAAISSAERIVTIEEALELQLQGCDNLVRLEARETDVQRSEAITTRDLLRAALRMRPDRIIVGEVRGPEALDMLTAMNTGHPGTLCTVHANSCRDATVRLANLVLAASRLPWEAILRSLASALDIIVFIERLSRGRRRVSEIVEVSGSDAQSVKCRTLYEMDTENDELVKV
ncbi:MAG: CpaF family protein [Clostridiaceae bacterium]|nr:CpaF family protein [Clostridiaceae bacterium]